MSRKIYYSIFTVFLFITFSLSFLVTKIKAVDAIPEPIVPCLDDDPKTWKNPEFNSLRPNQASPCQDSPKANMCGNIITVKVDSVEVDYCGEEWCEDKKPEQTKRVYINLSGVELPILGNTELVANSKNPTDQIDDAQKMNEYLSWYLAGTTNKAEYGADEDKNKIVDFSGPAKKLLPSAIQDFFRFETLHSAGTKTEIEDPETGEIREEAFNHNQITVCTTNNTDVTIFGVALTIPWVGEEKPTECYDGGKEAKGTVYRLLDWWDSKATGLIDSKNVISGWDGSQAWDYHVPPFPWQFEEDKYYRKAYNEWRGENCAFVFGLLVCIDIRVPGTRFDLKANKWANLYPYIPLSNTVDKKGTEFFDNVHTSAGDAHFASQPTYEVFVVPKLYYPHTVEVSDAVANLNKTFVPKEGVDIKAIPPGTEDNAQDCKVLDVRTNPGDDLTFENADSYMEFTVTYDVEEVRCKSTGNFTQPKPNPFGTPTPSEPIYDCSADVYATVNLTTRSPHLNDIWQNTIAGEGSTLRRIFPKIEEGAPISCLADIPGVSPATYTVGGTSDTGVSITRVLNPGGSTASSPEIYFPHLGGVYEYFLKGIQTALRPKGYGQPITNGESCTVAASCGTELPDLSGLIDSSCSLCADGFKADDASLPNGIPDLMKQIIEAAGSAYDVPASVIFGTMYHEGAFSGNRFEWTDENVREWSLCGGKMPNCNENASTAQYPYGWFPVYFNGGEEGKLGTFWDAVKVVDPARTKDTISVCNFMDATFATAESLNFWSQGLPADTKYPPHLDPSQTYSRFPDMCFNYDLRNGEGILSSCSAWDDNAVATTEVGYGGYCPEPGKHPLGDPFSEAFPFIQQSVEHFNDYSCK